MSITQSTLQGERFFWNFQMPEQAFIQDFLRTEPRLHENLVYEYACEEFEKRVPAEGLEIKKFARQAAGVAISRRAQALPPLPGVTARGHVAGSGQTGGGVGARVMLRPASPDFNKLEG